MKQETVDRIVKTLNQITEILEPVIVLTDQVKQIVFNLLEPIRAFLDIKTNFFDNKESMLSGINQNLYSVSSPSFGIVNTINAFANPVGYYTQPSIEKGISKLVEYIFRAL